MSSYGRITRIVAAATAFTMIDLTSGGHAIALAAQEGAAPGDFSSDTSGGVAFAEYEGDRIQWKVVYSPGHGGNVDKQLELEIQGDDVQLITSIGSLKDPAAPLQSVTLDVENPRGRRMGAQVKGKGLDAAQAAAGLKPFPGHPTFEKLGKAFNESRGRSFDVSSVVGEPEIEQAMREYRQSLKASKNVGFVEPAKGKAGIKALLMTNPSDKGRWKMHVNGSSDEPFLAVALALPIDPTGRDIEELRAVSEKIDKAIRAAFPAYQEQLIQDSCVRCKTLVWLAGFFIVAVSLVLAAVSIMTFGAGLTLLIGWFGLIVAIVGVLTFGIEHLAAAFMSVFKADYTCAKDNFWNFFCNACGADCNIDGCCYPPVGCMPGAGECVVDVGPCQNLSSGYYTIRQVSSGKYLDAYESSTQDYNIVTRDPQRNDTQVWLLTSSGTGRFRLRQKSSERYMDAHEDSGHDYSAVTRDIQNNDSQKWIPKRVGEDTYTFKQANTGRYLDAQASNVITQTRESDATQEWLFTRIEDENE